MINLTRQDWGFGRKIFVPLAAVTLVAVLAATYSLYWGTKRSDEVSVARQVRETRNAISLTLQQLAREQEAVAVWDALALELAKPEPNLQWIDADVGVWLHDLFSHDRVYILDADDRPLYVMADGQRVGLERYGRVAADLQPFIDAVRGRGNQPPGPHDRYPGQPVNAGSALLTSPRAIYDSGLAQLAGRPAAVSVMRIVPLTEATPATPGREPLLVSVVFLDAEFLATLSVRNLIAEPHFSRSPEPGAGEAVLPLFADDGRRIGFFHWKPELPGQVLRKRMGLLWGFTILLTVASMALLARWLWRTTGELRKTLVELQASEAHSQHLAFHDVLTGLPNRALFNARLDQALARARQGEPVAVLQMDLDRFKHVNDMLGHHAGDLLVCEVADRLSRLMREQDTVARLGGDEFALILSDCRPEEVGPVCERILAAVRAPFSLLGQQAHVGGSIGVFNVGDTGADRVEALRKADIALYRAKADGRNCYRVFTEEMDETVRLRSVIEQELRAAIATGEGLEVHYQPQVDGEDRRIIGLEALVRWRHPVRGMILPGQFIPIAEEAGLIGPLGEWVLREACEASKRWPDLFIAVNLSPMQFRNTRLAERLVEIVRQSGADPSRIELEVTESVFLNSSEVIHQALDTLHAAGIRIALDDFGTGYSSLSYLRQFDIDKIKIDRSFVQNADQDADSVAIVSAVISLGHAMGLTVVAEGVETSEQQRFLSAAGCNGMQGYLFSRPVPEHAVDTLLQDAAA